MSTIVFIGQTVTDKHLQRQTSYGYHPDTEMKEKILSDLAKHLNQSIPENVIVDLNINITLKEYNKNQSPEKYWYETRTS